MLHEELLARTHSLLKEKGNLISVDSLYGIFKLLKDAELGGDDVKDSGDVIEVIKRCRRRFIRDLQDVEIGKIGYPNILKFTLKNASFSYNPKDDEIWLNASFPDVKYEIKSYKERGVYKIELYLDDVLVYKKGKYFDNKGIIQAAKSLYDELNEKHTSLYSKPTPRKISNIFRKCDFLDKEIALDIKTAIIGAIKYSELVRADGDGGEVDIPSRDAAMTVLKTDGGYDNITIQGKKYIMELLVSTGESPRIKVCSIEGKTPTPVYLELDNDGFIAAIVEVVDSLTRYQLAMNEIKGV